MRAAGDEKDDGAGPPPPRANPELLGHEAAEATLRRLFQSDRMPHALLLTGPRGIGKATLAYRFARFVLAGGAGEGASPGLFAGDDAGLAIPSESGTFRRVAAGGHADLLTVERAYDPRRRRLRSEIVVDDAREIAAFLRLTAAEGGWRVVVVDGADEMNRNAANSLLKILEEPPRNALLLLVAHSPGKLLPTIRSRCRRFPLASLPGEAVRRLLRQYRPELPESHAEALLALSGGSIGRALELAAAGGVELHAAVSKLVTGVDDVAGLHAFADRLARGEAEDAYRAVEDLIGLELAGLACGAAQAGNSAEAARWAALREEIGQRFERTDALNLDRKQTILGAFFAIDDAAR
jgi:DNA polymerase III subunit delta'